MNIRIRYPRWLHDLLMLLVVPLWFVFVVMVCIYLVYEFAGRI